ncbi:hypothetical protein RB195_006577 [Necator americanus]|uniref:ELMO domain-containing protein n=1 Tax=Necator americanus TaxID=51031 RepID=A0ABR1BW86_NECAM
MRTSTAAWQLVPVWMHCISIVAAVLGVIPTEEECVEKLIELLFRCDSSFNSLFAVTVQLFHRTWREMHASQDEHEKVANVVHEQLRRAANNRPANLTTLEELLLSLPYWKMKELWKRELIEKENNQLSSEVVGELRNLLKPSIEQLVRTNRKNALRQGFTFRRQVKGKTPHKGEDQYCFWKLDASDLLCLTDTDVDPYVEGVSHVGNVRKIAVKDIASVERIEDMTGRKSGAHSMRCIRIVLHDGSSISGATFSDRVLSAWLDGLMDLTGSTSLSHDAMSTADRLLNIELRLRLMDVPNPQTATEIPPLPADFNWVKPLFTQDLKLWVFDLEISTDVSLLKLYSINRNKKQREFFGCFLRILMVFGEVGLQEVVELLEKSGTFFIGRKLGRCLYMKIGPSLFVNTTRNLEAEVGICGQKP